MENMSTIRFTTEIGEDYAIHLPAGVHLTPGRVDVIVVQPSDESPSSQEGDVRQAEVPAVARDLASFADNQGILGLPPDYALNHDHYLHGAMKGNQ